MTSKEKAESIFHQMYKILWHTNAEPIHCKECALIVVEQILNSDPNNLHSEYDYNEYKLGVDVEYWTEVKEEIEKIDKL
jgi:hypothetical protein